MDLFVRFLRKMDIFLLNLIKIIQRLKNLNIVINMEFGKIVDILKMKNQLVLKLKKEM